MARHLRWALLLALATRCATAPRVTFEDLAGPAPEPAPPGVDLDALTTELGREARLDTVLRVALARNPALTDVRERVRGQLERATQSARLPDLEVSVELSGVPLLRPYALQDSQSIMVGARQAFPPATALEARGREAVEEARGTATSVRSIELDLVARAKRAWLGAVTADRVLKLRREQLGLLENAVGLTRSVYRLGRGKQQDVLRLRVEIARLRGELPDLEQQRRSAVAMLNTLMGRAPDAALGPLSAVARARAVPALAELDQTLERLRPDVAAARHAIKKGEASLDAAKSSASWPTFMVGANYAVMPMGKDINAYGVMVTMTLPWLNPAHREEVRAAERSIAASQAALDSAKLLAHFEVHDAWVKLDATRKVLANVESSVLPAAEKSFQSARSAFAAGTGDALELLDALRTIVDARLERVLAETRVDAALIDLERAAATFTVSGDAP